LESQPLLGGDVASRYPLRIAAGILAKAQVKVEPWLKENSAHLPFRETEVNLILAQLGKNSGVETTSCGRVLDAVAAVLGICYERSYEGEPAMKLESAAIGGKDVLKLKSEIEGETLETSSLLRLIFENKAVFSAGDLAYSAHAYLGRGLGSQAVEKATVLGVKSIGFSGGAACNQILTKVMRKTVEDAGLRFLVNEAVPAGDGGISFGQAVVGGFSRF
jgi:hydrogenase maturation protein HypF